MCEHQEGLYTLFVLTLNTSLSSSVQLSVRNDFSERILDIGISSTKG